jgi:hypothetical protein
MSEASQATEPDSRAWFTPFIVETDLPLRPRIVLKARPTVEQLADRVGEPMPEGLEVYLDAKDIADDGWLRLILDRLDRLAIPAGFTWLVEGPIRSLDRTFFDATVDSDANREVLRRLVLFGTAVDARAACIHLIAPTEHLRSPDRDDRLLILKRSLPLLRFYRDLCHDAGIIPTIENIPPVSRMRESRVMTSSIGVFPSDMVWVAQQLDDVAFTLDLSHAHLSVNAQTWAGNQDDRSLDFLVESFSSQAEVVDLVEFVDVVLRDVVTVHVSDAQGLLGEGLPYGVGDAPLDAALRRLLPTVSYLVTEVLEPNPDRCPEMRAAEEKLIKLRAEMCSPEAEMGP